MYNIDQKLKITFKIFILYHQKTLKVYQKYTIISTKKSQSYTLFFCIFASESKGVFEGKNVENEASIILVKSIIYHFFRHFINGFQGVKGPKLWKGRHFA